MTTPLTRLLLVASGAGLLAVLYVGAPLWAAHDIRRAAKAGDIARLEQKVEWESLRDSLKASLREAGQPNTAAGGAPPRRSLWQRVKAAAAPSVTDRLVDRFVTPQGVAQLARSGDAMAAIARAAGLKRAPDAKIETRVLQADAAPRDPEAFTALIMRLRRIALHTPLHFEFEIADRRDPARRYVSTMRLRGLDWKLTEIRVIGPGLAL